MHYKMQHNVKKRNPLKKKKMNICMAKFYIKPQYIPFLKTQCHHGSDTSRTDL